MGAQALAEERFESAGAPASYTSHLPRPLQGRCHSSLGWVCLWEGRCPRREGASSAYTPSHPGEKHPWPGAASALRDAAKDWAWPGCSCEGPERRESKQPCGPGFHLPASKRCKQTLSPCQAAAAPCSRPQTVLPLLLLLLPGKPAASQPQGHPRGASPPPGVGKGSLSQAEGRKGLGPSHLDVFPPWTQLGAGG